MKIFITGVTGFVGGMLANKFIEAGFEVTGLGRKENLPLHVDKRCIYIKNDITKPISEITADVVIHAAAQVNDNASYQNHYDNNVTGTVNVVNACKHKNCLFILISTSSVYSFKKNTAYSEDEAGKPFEALSSYGKTKFLAEQIVINTTYLNRKIILRPRAIYGPGDTVLLPRLLRLVKNNFIILPQHISTQISLTHINNLMDAVKNCFSLKPEGTFIFNVADYTIYSLKKAVPTLIKSTIERKLNVVFIPKLLWNLFVKFNSVFHLIPELTCFGSKQLTQIAILNTTFIKNKLSHNPSYNFYSSLKTKDKKNKKELPIQ